MTHASDIISYNSFLDNLKESLNSIEEHKTSLIDFLHFVDVHKIKP